MEEPKSSDARQRRRAILFVIGSAAMFTVAAALVKVASPEIPTVELMLFRSGTAMLCLLPLMIRGGGWMVLRTRRPWSNLVRSLAGLGGMFGSFYGYGHLPLAAATALGFAMPIFLAMMSVPLLHERLTPARLGSVGAGLVGVLLVVRPWEGDTGLPLFDAAVVLAGVAAWALAMASIRWMGQAGERSLTIVVLFSVICTVISAGLTLPVWVTPRPGLWLVLVGVGLVSTGAQLLMTEGYRSGEASMLAPFEYSAIFCTVAMGWAIWGEVPGAWEGAGIAVLVVSGLFAWWWETRG